MPTLIKKTYICNDCEHKGVVINSIKDNRAILSEFSPEAIENGPDIDKAGIYEYETLRDSDGIRTGFRVYSSICSECGSHNIQEIKKENWDNVLNFYPPGEPEKWFRGFQK
jgi:hypothetical protein